MATIRETRRLHTNPVHRDHDGVVYPGEDSTSVTTTDSEVSGAGTAARIINFIAGLIIAVLALRFILMLLGANRGNAFVDFIYSTSYPFAAPFFGMFNYQETFGRSRFEFETIIAMAVYALIAWGIIKLIAISARDDDVDVQA